MRLNLYKTHLVSIEEDTLSDKALLIAQGTATSGWEGGLRHQVSK